MREESMQVGVVVVCRVIGWYDGQDGCGCRTPVDASLEYKCRRCIEKSMLQQKQHWRFKDAEANSSSVNSKTEFEFACQTVRFILSASS